MSEPSTLRVVERHFQNMVGTPAKGDAPSESGDWNTELAYLQVGQRYRIAPAGQYPVQQFMLLFTNGRSMEVKYAYITERFFSPVAGDQGLNEMIFRIRDCLQVTVTGFNLTRLNDDLVLQRVVDLGAVSHLHAQAALKSDPHLPVICGLRYEYGLMDMHHGVWKRGNGHWSEEEQRWIGQV